MQELKPVDLVVIGGGIASAGDLLLEVARTLPGGRELALVECTIGFRPALRDHLPAIEAHVSGLVDRIQRMTRSGQDFPKP